MDSRLENARVYLKPTLWQEARGSAPWHREPWNGLLAAIQGDSDLQ